MLWATIALIYAACQHTGDRRRRRGLGLVPTTWRLMLVGGGLAMYACTATLLYFANGFGTFIAAYALSVVAVVGLALSIFLNERPAVGQRPRRLLATAALTYGGGAALLWLPGELLCHSIPIIRRLPLHAIFHLTSAAGPHLGLTAFALARFDDEATTSARPALQFAGLPAIHRAGLFMEKQL